MEAERGLHHATYLPRLEGEGSVGKGLDHVAPPEAAEAAAASLGAGIIGVLAGQRGEVLALARLSQELVGGLACLVLAAGGPRSPRALVGDQDV